MPIPPPARRACTAPAAHVADLVHSAVGTRERDIKMKYIPVEMIRDTMDHLPDFSLPAGYTIRTFAPGNERLWA
jgi:hypothetical protein